LASLALLAPGRLSGKPTTRVASCSLLFRVKRQGGQERHGRQAEERLSLKFGVGQRARIESRYRSESRRDLEHRRILGAQRDRIEALRKARLIRQLAADVPVGHDARERASGRRSDMGCREVGSAGCSDSRYRYSAVLMSCSGAWCCSYAFAAIVSLSCSRIHDLSSFESFDLSMMAWMSPGFAS